VVQAVETGQRTRWMRCDGDLHHGKVMVVQSLRLGLQWGYFVRRIRQC